MKAIAYFFLSCMIIFLRFMISEKGLCYLNFKLFRALFRTLGVQFHIKLQSDIKPNSCSIPRSLGYIFQIVLGWEKNDYNFNHSQVV